MSSPVLSIIIVTFNAAEAIPRTLESIARQENIAQGEIEVLVVDGGSSDATAAIARASSIVGHVTSESDAGIYDAMNKGAMQAHGRWLHFLNAGDSWAGGHSLSMVLEGLRKAEIGGRVWAISRAINLGGTGGQAREIPSFPHTWWRHAVGVQPHCHQASWFDRETFTRSGMYSMEFGTAADFDLVLRFGLLTSPEHIDLAAILYEGGGVSEGAFMSTRRMLHKIRAERMGLGRSGRALDLIMTRIIDLSNRARILAGRMRGTVLGG